MTAIERLALVEARLGPLAPMLRYGAVAAANTLVGYGLFAGFVALGIDRFAAQLMAHLIGMAWNYVSYGQAVFRGRRGSKLRYLGAYALSYLVNLALLALFTRLGLSAYLAGLATLIAASLLNLLVLQRFVFRPA